jgi:hypothetical protein
MIKMYLPLCPLHYHQCISGKSPEVHLKENYGIAKFNAKTQKIDYPTTVPKNRFPLSASARPRKGLMVIPLQKDSRTLQAAVRSRKSFMFCSPHEHVPHPQLSDPSSQLTGGTRLVAPGGNTGEPLELEISTSCIHTQNSGGSSGVDLDQCHPLVTGRGQCEDNSTMPLLVDVGQEERSVSGVGEVGTTKCMSSMNDQMRMSGLKCLACKSPTTVSTFYVDSGAGQCLSSCSTAFLSLEPCQIEVVGIAGTLPIFGIGTAVFALTLKGGHEILIRIHNCRYSFGEFNLLSVSQMSTIRSNTLDLSLHAPHIRLYAAPDISVKSKFVDIPLVLDDGLYALTMEPVSADDQRHVTSPIYDMTPVGDYIPVSGVGYGEYAPGGQSRDTRQMWTTVMTPTVLATGRIFTLAGSVDFHSELSSFSDLFLAPAALPPSRRQFDIKNAQDMSDLSIRFLGGGTDRILHTVGISNGLAKPPSKNHARVPPLNFPQGNMKEFKTPIVSKDIVGYILTGKIGEILYTDTIYTGDRKFPYAQVFVDRVSRYGDVIPLRSRTEVGAAFVTFVCRHYTPLILISDNISENHGGDLVEQCRLRDVKQLFTCPYHPQMDFAEGYIGRITTMASFAMVYSGAPLLFMWIWSVKTAVFVNQIMASYNSVQKTWATPYELVHGELFPDASIVVPFGCGVLVLLPKSDRAKFKSRCALMLFVHYADDHPL